MSRRKVRVLPGQGVMFEGGTPPSVDPLLKALERPVWTQNKADLIARYLHLFVLITKHGTYIDAFAGPQRRRNPDLWAARLVLANQPFWLTDFLLLETAKDKVQMLEEQKRINLAQIDQLRRENPEKRIPRRRIDVLRSDSNLRLPQLLQQGRVHRKRAAFALLDQRTFECHWATVEHLAHYKETPKIELFYFFPVGWLARALAALKDLEKARAWWGREDWELLRGQSSWEQAQLMSARIRGLGYASVKPWPIYASREDRRIMYFMIHASDHPEAGKLMRRAYQAAVGERESLEQLLLEFDAPPGVPDSDDCPDNAGLSTSPPESPAQ